MPADAVPLATPLAQLKDLSDREQQLQQLLSELHHECQQAVSERQQQLELRKQLRAELRIKQEKARAREALAKARLKTQASDAARQQLQRAKQQLTLLKDQLRTLRSEIQGLETELTGYREALRFHKQREKALQTHHQQWRQRRNEQPRRGRPPKGAERPKPVTSKDKRTARSEGVEVPLSRRRGRLPLGPGPTAAELPSIFDPLP